jgi:hypothetical protein
MLILRIILLLNYCLGYLRNLVHIINLIVVYRKGASLDRLGGCLRDKVTRSILMILLLLKIGYRIQI